MGYAIANKSLLALRAIFVLYLFTLYWQRAMVRFCEPRRFTIIPAAHKCAFVR